MTQKITDRLKDLEQQIIQIKQQNLNLDITRGKPSSEQLDLSMDMLSIVTKDNFKSENNTDCRNYGILDGLPEIRKFFADILEVTSDEIFIGGNSSLTLMHDIVSFAYTQGYPESKNPWCNDDKVKFLCPVPGYDRHFSICEHFNIEMINVPMNEFGPDMDLVEKLVAEDESIKGIWCVPKYQNPTGITFSDDVVSRLAKMPTKANDFKIIWDNAYTVHHLTANKPNLKNIHQECINFGNDNRVIEEASTSKITFAGAGVAAIATSIGNMTWLKKNFSYQAIGYNKINQLRHLYFFKDTKGLAIHMEKHAKILKPKFDAVIKTLENNLAGKDIASWTSPTGGYFISLDTKPNLAKKVVKMVADLGVKLTPAGATYPYNKDPDDSNIRIAPSMPVVSDVEKAAEVLAIALEYITLGSKLK